MVWAGGKTEIEGCQALFAVPMVRDDFKGDSKEL
jgi:hypothetical protein